MKPHTQHSNQLSKENKTTVWSKVQLCSQNNQAEYEAIHQIPKNKELVLGVLGCAFFTCID